MTSTTEQAGGFVESSGTVTPAERIESRIYFIPGEKVMLDADLAALYGVTTGALNQAVKRNHERFPADFMFHLTEAETTAILRSQIVTSNAETEAKPRKNNEILISQSVISKSVGKGGRRHQPFAFTEQGVAMLSSVLRSPRAVQVNIAIMRTFVRLRQLIASNADLARKLASLERKYDAQFKVVFDAIRALMSPDVPGRNREMGFHTGIDSLRSTPGRRKSSAKA